VTSVAAVIFMVTSLTLSIFAQGGGPGRSVVTPDSEAAPAPAAPPEGRAISEDDLQSMSAAPETEGEAEGESAPAAGDASTEAAPAVGDASIESAPAAGEATTDSAPAAGDASTEAAPAAGEADEAAPEAANVSIGSGEAGPEAPAAGD
jgi:hypothetical protein